MIVMERMHGFDPNMKIGGSGFHSKNNEDELRELRELRELKELREMRDARDTRDTRDTRDARERDSREEREVRQTRNSRDSSDGYYNASFFNVARLDEFKKQVLFALKKAFDERQQVSCFYDGEQPGDACSLSVLFTDFGEENYEVLGEFCFLPEKIIDTYLIFNIIFSITEDVDMRHFDELSRVVQKVNFNLPVGAFILDDNERVLAYKHVLVVPCEEKSVDNIVGYLIRILGSIIDVVEKKVGILYKVEKGEITF